MGACLRAHIHEKMCHLHAGPGWEQGSPQKMDSEEYDESFWQELDKVVEEVSTHQPAQQQHHQQNTQQPPQQQQQPLISPAATTSQKYSSVHPPTATVHSAPAAAHAAALQPDHSCLSLSHSFDHEAGGGTAGEVCFLFSCP